MPARARPRPTVGQSPVRTRPQHLQSSAVDDRAVSVRQLPLARRHVPFDHHVDTHQHRQVDERRVPRRARLAGVRWPEGAPVPEDWAADRSSGRLMPAGRVIRGNGPLPLIARMPSQRERVHSGTRYPGRTSLISTTKGEASRLSRSMMMAYTCQVWLHRRHGVVWIRRRLPGKGPSRSWCSAPAQAQARPS